MIYQFKIQLKDVPVPVWRRIQVDSEANFEDFHYILMVAFEWLGGHLHEFDIRKSDGARVTNVLIGTSEEDPMPASDPFVAHMKKLLSQSGDSPFPRHLLEKDEKLSDWFKKEKDRAVYTYDFGDDWRHDIVLEKILEPDPDIAYPICIKAKNEAPLEDSRFDMYDDEIDLVNPNAHLIVEVINEIFRSDDWKEDFIDIDEFL